MSSRRLFVLSISSATAALTMAGCASSGATTRARRDPDVITQEEMAPYIQDTLEDAIRRARPNWLRRGGQGVIGQTDRLQVYVGGAKFGDERVLSEIAVRDVRRLEYMNGPDATTRFGTGNGGGAVLVAMR